MTASLITKAQIITGWPDARVAEIIGVSRPTIQAWRVGRNPEYLTALQIHALLMAVRLYRDQIDQGLAELEMLA